MALNLSETQVLDNIQILLEDIQNEFVKICNLVKGDIALILDPELSLPLSLCVDPPLLKKCRVTKLYELKDQDFQTTITKLFFYLKPRLEMMSLVADYIRSQEKVSSSCEIFIVFVPRRSMICEKELEKLGVLGAASLIEFQMDLLPLDGDILTLPNLSFTRELIDNDTSQLLNIAKSLIKFQVFFGKFQTIDWIGEYSGIVSDILQKTITSSFSKKMENSKVDQLIIFDRRVDLLSPLVTQLTYEGLIDEIHGLQNGNVLLNPEVLGQRGNKKIRIPLNSTDPIYSLIRDKNMSTMGEFLKRTIKNIAEKYGSRTSAKTLGELKDFVKMLPPLQKKHHSLGTHLSIYQDLVRITGGGSVLKKRIEIELGMLADGEKHFDYLKELIYREEDINIVLRLLCIQSIVIGGLKNKQFDFFRREIVHTYGFEHVVTLTNLEKLGLLKKKEGGNTFNSLRKNLKLFDDNFFKTNDISLVHSGYAPLSIRLIQKLFDNKNGWKSIDDLIKNNLGTNYGSIELVPKEKKSQNSKIQNFTKKLCLVFFIGGVTYAEISALRILSQRENSNVEFIIATTNMLNGNQLIRTSFPEKEK
ncbi:vacuolar protein sorting-associated protein 33a [Anaeramoeba flamelloides]|uniref:Vacuolar protein sorting-associated protein 33a n=1 Tax=Anaeramoeba flamelloides TaxID=1746091 RepID=A0AAV7ZBY5_9EUKA|nr:vacuolar protein sorting-associated protein 33a [Anaeramoeba flamelloides]KAJ6240097.1 vacuolar protein sorting-associated protein 33a [Anaeramoeba flamelloides]